MTADEQREYGYKLKSMRLAAGLTQHEVGLACDTATRTVQYWEQGRRLPSIDKLQALSNVLKVPVNQVIP